MTDKFEFHIIIMTKINIASSEDKELLDWLYFLDNPESGKVKNIMQDNKREEVINNMLKLRESLSEGLKENNQEIENIGYYKDFRFKGTQFGVNDAFVVKIKDDSVPQKEMEPREAEEKYIYEIYDKDNNLVATVDIEGNVSFVPEYFEGMDDAYLEALDLENAEFELPEELEKDDLVLTKGELDEIQNSRRIEDVSKKIGKEEISSYSEMKTDQKPLFDKITNKQEIDQNTRVTQTETLADMIPELKEKGIVKVGVVYSDHSKGQSGRFSIVEIEKDGNIQKINSLQNIEVATTGQTVTSINSTDGSVVEQEQVAGMVRINGRSKANGEEEYLSVKVGNYGILEVDYVRADLSKDKDERYLSAPIETQNMKPTTREVREFMDKSKNTDISEEIERANPEIDRDDDTQMQNIDDTAGNDEVTPDDIIVLEDGTKTTLRLEAEKDKVSPEEFTRRYNENAGKTPDEKIDNLHDEIEEEFGAPSRNR